MSIDESKQRRFGNDTEDDKPASKGTTKIQKDYNKETKSINNKKEKKHDK